MVVVVAVLAWHAFVLVARDNLELLGRACVPSSPAIPTQFSQRLTSTAASRYRLKCLCIPFSPQCFVAPYVRGLQFAEALQPCFVERHDLAGPDRRQ